VSLDNINTTSSTTASSAATTKDSLIEQSPAISFEGDMPVPMEVDSTAAAAESNPTTNEPTKLTTITNTDTDMIIDDDDSTENEKRPELRPEDEDLDDQLETPSTGPYSKPDAQGRQWKKVTSDSGVLKKILKVGDGWVKPEKGDEVHVLYIGRLRQEDQGKGDMEGDEFDRNQDRVKPFSFTLGKGILTYQ
jgi:FKBP-type peptidyl-prolyl cis-trans isomerase